MRCGLALFSLVGLASSAIVWDGRVNEWSTSAELSNWSWSNQVGPYQYYIHGPSAVSSYVNLSPAYKNPADSGSAQGLKITLDSTAYWNGQNMRRTELIPQKSPPSALTTGKLFYHFSISRKAENAPSLYREHQIAFFESHFTELKSGANSGQPGPDNTLRWAVSGQTKWSTVWEAGVWYNFAYEIDFSANTVALWSSTGAAPLALTVPAVSVSTSSNGADWHVGVLELPNGNADTNEDFFFSGVYIENGSITTSVAGPGGVVEPPSSTTTIAPLTTTSIKTTTRVVTTSTRISVGQTTRTSTPVGQTTPTTFTTRTSVRTTTATVSSSLVLTTTTSAASGGPTSGPWGQCGGNGWTGPKACGLGWVCKVTNEWYSQCLQG